QQSRQRLSNCVWATLCKGNDVVDLESLSGVGGLLETARRKSGAATDSVLLDEALRALVGQHRAAEIDQAYSAYDEQPLDQSDEWGDLASFHEAIASHDHSRP